MWPRVIIGVVLGLLGALWIAQGVGAAKGSPMTGHPSYAFLGAIVVLLGAWLIVAGVRRGRAPTDPSS